MAGQGSGAVVLEFLGEHERGGSVALVRGACRHLAKSYWFSMFPVCTEQVGWDGFSVVTGGVRG